MKHRVAGSDPQPDSAVTDADLLLDTAVIAVVSALICFAADQLALMSVAVPVVLGARIALWSRGRSQADRLREVALFSVCAVLGAFNDWNSVDAHRIYAYLVPHGVAWSTIPIWMLLFWGMILRFFLTVGAWHRIGLGTPSNRLHLPGRVFDHAGLRVTFLLALVCATRQSIYRQYLDPVWSWLPFAIALLLYVLVSRPRRPELRLGALVLVVGPAVEVLYIQVAGLHRYPLGWLGGVPLWIVLWWVLAVWVWNDLGHRLRRGLAHGMLRPRVGAAARAPRSVL